MFWRVAVLSSNPFLDCSGILRVGGVWNRQTCQILSSSQVLKMEECLKQLVGAIHETMESSFYIAHITLSLYHGSGQCKLKPITMSSWIKFSDEMESKLDILILICFHKHCIQLGDIKMKQSIGMCCIWKEAEAICGFQLCVSLLNLVLVCILFPWPRAYRFVW